MLYPFSRLCRPARSPASGGLAARKKRGFNLIEAAVVLGVVGLVIGGIWVAAAAVSFDRNINSLTAAVVKIIDGVRAKGDRTYWVGPTVSGAGSLVNLTLTAFDMGLVPTDFIYGVGPTSEPYFGKFALDVWATTGSNQKDIHVDLIIPDLSPMGQSLCIALSRRLTQVLYNTGPVNTVNSTLSNVLIIEGGSQTKLALNSTITLSAIRTACTSDVYNISVYVPF